MKRNFKNILAMVMVATIIFGNSFCVSASEVEQHASCIHSYGDWQYHETSYKVSSDIEKCLIRVTHYIRVCSKCGANQKKTSEYQMEHSWGELDNGLYKCLNCHRYMGTVR